jgi:outer membrane protein assembly factor BamB
VRCVADGEVRAYETATGEPRWAVPLPTIDDLHREWALPSGHDGIVHVGYTDPLFSWGVHGGFLKIDAETGVDTMVNSQGAVRSPATFAGDDVWYRYGEVGAMRQGVFTGIEGRLADGRTMRTLDGAAFTGQGTPPAVADGVAYAMRADGGFLDAYDADATEGCSDAGAYRLCTPLWSAPVTGAGCGAATCAPRWSAATPGVPTQVVVASGRVLVLTGTGELVAFGLP